MARSLIPLDERLAAMVLGEPPGGVMDAMRNLLIQNLQLSWHYSVGNAYEAFYQPESSDYSGDINEVVYGLHHQSRAWRGFGTWPRFGASPGARSWRRGTSVRRDRSPCRYARRSPARRPRSRGERPSFRSRSSRGRGRRRGTR